MDETTIEQVKGTLSEHEVRLRLLEERWVEMVTFVAVREERDKHLDKRFDRLEKGMSDVKGYLLKIVWAIITGIIIGVLTVLMSGVLSITA